jgi:hypothetical protein
MSLVTQRVPRGLQNVLAISGVDSLTALNPELRGVLDVLQCYGLQQLSVSTVTNAALAEGGIIAFTLDSWAVLFGMAVNVTKTATMTAGAVSLRLQREQNGLPIAYAPLGPFGATETGTVIVPWRAPYPLLCPPGTVCRAVLDILGTDAAAAVTLTIEAGIVG